MKSHNNNSNNNKKKFLTRTTQVTNDRKNNNGYSVIDNNNNFDNDDQQNHHHHHPEEEGSASASLTLSSLSSLRHRYSDHDHNNKDHGKYKEDDENNNNNNGQIPPLSKPSHHAHPHAHAHDDDYDYDDETLKSPSLRPIRTSNSSSITWNTYIYAFCAALNSCNLGYDIGVSTNVGPQLQNEFELTDTKLELFLGSLNFWSIFGALLSPTISDIYGRKSTFRAAAIMFLLGIVIMSTSTTFTILMIGRCIVGLGVGIGEAIDPMYIAEIVPTSIRGELVSWAEAGVAVGVVLGFSSSLLFYSSSTSTLSSSSSSLNTTTNNTTMSTITTMIDHHHHHNHQEWRYMLALGAILPVIMLFLIQFVMPESPRWLLSKHQESAARIVLEQIYPPTTTTETTTEVDRIVQEIQSSIALEEAASQAIGWEAIYRPSPAVRRMLLVGVGVAIIQQAVGIDSVMFYLMFVLQQSGIESELGQILALIALGSVKLLFVFVGAKLFDKVGRRPLFFISLLGCAASLILVSFMFDDEEDNNNNMADDDDTIMDSSSQQQQQIFLVMGLALYLAFFSSGLGPGNWVVVSEVFATSIRAKAMSVAILPNRITATIMASTFLSMAKLLTWPGFFLYLAGICLVSALFIYIYLPETKGKSLEEMSMYFAEITGDRSILNVEQQIEEEEEENTPKNDDIVEGFHDEEVNAFEMT